MAGSGPPPKPPELRHRTNASRGSTTRIALDDNRQKARVPTLGRRRGLDGKIVQRGEANDWLPETRAWWRDVWRSPMAVRYTKADRQALLVLADLWEAYWRGDRGLAAEIRLSSAPFGLSPLARLRLNWDVVGDAMPAKKPAAATPPPPTFAPPATPGVDPRFALRAVK